MTLRPESIRIRGSWWVDNMMRKHRGDQHA